MSEKDPSFAQRAIFEASREVIEKRDLDPRKFRAIVAEISTTERQNLNYLFQLLSEVTDPKGPFELTPEIKAQLDNAKKIFGPDYMGPEQIEEAWGSWPEQIPPLPESFTPERLKRAKKLGMMLILHLDKTPGDTPWTMESMQFEFGDADKRIPYAMGEFKSDDFYDKDTSRFGWKLVGKKVLPNSCYKDEVQQLEIIANYLKNTLFKGMKLPAAYKAAIDEFKAKKDEICKLIKDKNLPEAAKMIEALTLSKLTCGLPVEYMQTFETYYQNRTKNREEFLLYENAFQTMRRSNRGDLVHFYCPHAYGVGAYDTQSEEGGSYKGIFLMLAS